MQNEILPPFSHPVSVQLVDDNQTFLLDEATMLSRTRFTYELSGEPKKLAESLNKRFAQDPFIGRYQQELPMGPTGDRRLDVSVSKLRKELCFLSRFEKPAIVLSDVDMPDKGMNGIEFCKSLKNPLIQKILVSGALSENEAIEALSAGHVQQVIFKKNTGLERVINPGLDRAFWRYFVELTKALYGSASPYSPNSAPLDPHCFTLLRQEMDLCGAVEHMMLDPRGTFMLIDASGKTFLLFVRTIRQLQHDMELPQAKSADPSVLEDLRTYKRMVCYCDPDHTRTPEGSEWKKITRPIHSFQGDQPIYYTCVATKVKGIDHKHLVPFSRYEQPQHATGCIERRKA